MLRLTRCKYLRKIIFGIKIEIGIFELSNVPNVNKFKGFLIMRPTLTEKAVNIY